MTERGNLLHDQTHKDVLIKFNMYRFRMWTKLNIYRIDFDEIHKL